jgi:hypothetical protein
VARVRFKIPLFAILVQHTIQKAADGDPSYATPPLYVHAPRFSSSDNGQTSIISLHLIGFQVNMHVSEPLNLAIIIVQYSTTQYSDTSGAAAL